MVRDDYEISLWEDYIYNPAEDPNNSNGVYTSFYKERKIAVIGSNTMTTGCRAFNPVLTENINGTKVFSFKMFYNCREDSYQDAIQQIMVVNGEAYDNFMDSSQNIIATEEIRSDSKIYKNPFLNFLVNERKVKVKWKEKWYDFVIKSCDENSGDKSVTYTCEDAYINELSKTGFNIELNNDLQNNQGTVKDLAIEILKNTDWEVEDSDISFLKEKREEVVYEMTTIRSMSAILDTDSSQVTIPSASTILLYYSQVQELCNSLINNSTDPFSTTGEVVNYLQFAYARNYEKDNSTGLVTNANFFHFSGIYSIIFTNSGVPETFILKNLMFEEIGRINLEEGVSTNYRAEMLIRKQKNVFDTRTKKYCDVYVANNSDTNNMMDEGDIIYKYTTIRYDDPTIINNLVVNSKDFSSTSGWIGTPIGFKLYSPSENEYLSVLTMGDSLEQRIYYNNGLSMQSSYIPDGISNGEQYVFRFKARNNQGVYITDPSKFILSVRQYMYDSQGNIILNPNSPSYFVDTTQDTTYEVESPWIQRIFTCNRSATRADIYTNKIGMFFTTTDEIWIEEIQVFKLITDSSGIIIAPGEIDKDSIINTIYTYFNHTTTSLNLEISDIPKIWESSTDWDYGNLLTPIYNFNFEKIRSISAKQSNCLNLLQSLAEIFECRLEFYVPHEENGDLIYDEEFDREHSIWYGKPRKYLRILPLEGNKIGIGFIYGIDLKEIRRTIKSDQIITKMIVLPNVNEFAEDGVCAIERSKENYSRANFILNFDYYINQGFLNREDLYNDLYNTAYIGYYYWLNKYNLQYDALTNDLIVKKQELSRKQSYLSVYDSAITSLNEQIQIAKEELMKILDLTWSEVEIYISENYDTPENIPEPVLTRIVIYINSTQMLNEYMQTYQSLVESIQRLKIIINYWQFRQTVILDRLKSKDLEFYRKYSRFLREGCWSGNEYINDDLYYFDAVKNTNLSSRPVVNYDISVMRVSALEDFRNKVFRVGDVSFIQDISFFGYTLINGVKTPYKEKVTISEIVSNFDEPHKDTIKVQNYKTEFEDLFQRFNSTLQALQFAQSKSYRR